MRTPLFLTAGLSLTLVCCPAPLLARGDSLDIYQDLTGKTVLMSSAVQAPPESLVPDPVTDWTNALAAIEKELAKQGIEIVQDGPHFVRLFPKSAWEFASNAPLRGAEVGLPGAAAAPGSSEGMRPKAMMGISGADVHQVLDIYSGMRKRTALCPVSLPVPAVRLRSNHSLTFEESIYAMETVLRLNGLWVVDDGTKFVQIIPMQQKPELRAPKPEPGAKLIDPKKVPPVEGSVPTVPGTEVERLEQELERLRQALYGYLHNQRANQSPAPRLLELYACATGKTAVASTNFDRWPIYFCLQTPVTRNELVYAIETTFKLNGLAIIPVDERQIRLGSTGEPRRRNGQPAESVRPK